MRESNLPPHPHRGVLNQISHSPASLSLLQDILVMLVEVAVKEATGRRSSWCKQWQVRINWQCAETDSQYMEKEKNFNVIFCGLHYLGFDFVPSLSLHTLFQHPLAGGRESLLCCITVPSRTLCTGIGIQQQATTSTGIEPNTSKREGVLNQLSHSPCMKKGRRNGKNYVEIKK